MCRHDHYRRRLLGGGLALAGGLALTSRLALASRLALTSRLALAGGPALRASSGSFLISPARGEGTLAGKGRPEPEEAPAPAAQKLKLPAPGPYDACPVCGMFPARYREWVATIVYRDKKAVHFDGAKDMFKYLLDLQKYAPGRKREDIAAMGVTGYYAAEMIDARAARYVVGSDVLGPMGHELVPHPDDYDAKEFLKDHHGRGILLFGDVTMPLLVGLDEGKFGFE